MTIVRAPSAWAIRNAAVATPPPIPQISTHSPACSRGPRDEHPVGGLVDERERGGLLERDTVAERHDVRRRDRGELGVDALRVLADHVDVAAVLEARVDHDRLAGLEALDVRPSASTTPEPSAPRMRGFGHGRAGPSASRRRDG